MVNEKRLIDANAGKKVFCAVAKPAEYNGVIHMVVPISEIDKLPTVDAVPVVHGRWEQCFEDWRKQIEGDKCSACGFEHYGCGIKHYHYCPNCGAKMDGDGNA